MKPKIQMNDVTRIKYILDELGYENARMNEPKIEELTRGLHQTIFMMVARAQSETNARAIVDLLLPTVKELEAPITTITHTRVDAEYQQMWRAWKIGEIGHIIDEDFETSHQTEQMESTEVGRLFDHLSQRLDDGSERKRHSDTIIHFSINFCNTLSNKFKDNAEISKMLVRQQAKLLNELELLKLSERTTEQQSHLRQARECYSFMCQVEMISKAGIDATLADDVVSLYTQQATGKKAGTFGPGGIKEAKELKEARKKKCLQFMDGKEEVTTREITEMFPDINEKTVQHDLMMMVREKTITKKRFGVYSITTKGKKSIGQPEKKEGDD